MPSTCSTPFKADSSGKNTLNRPDCSSNFNPTEGFGEAMILLNSSMMRSLETIFNRSRFAMILSNVTGSIVKFNCEAKRTARIIRKGSSENVMIGSRGVFNIPSSKS